MKKILCLVDSSAHMSQYIQFVGSLAHDVDAKIFLASTQPTKSRLLAAGSHNYQEHLDEWHDYLSGIRHVSTQVESFNISSNPYQKLNSLGGLYDLITMSITSFDNGKTLASGLSLSRILNEIQHPILLVPGDVTHWETKRLIYDFDFRNESPDQLIQLGHLADWFKAGIKFYTLPGGDLSLDEQAKRDSVLKKFTEARRGKNNITYEPTAYPTKLHFEKTYQAYYGDLPVIAVQPSGLVDRLLGKHELTGTIGKTSSPYLIIPQQALKNKTEG